MIVKSCSRIILYYSKIVFLVTGGVRFFLYCYPKTDMKLTNFYKYLYFWKIASAYNHGASLFLYHIEQSLLFDRYCPYTQGEPWCQSTWQYHLPHRLKSCENLQICLKLHKLYLKIKRFKLIFNFSKGKNLYKLPLRSLINHYFSVNYPQRKSKSYFVLKNWF